MHLVGVRAPNQRNPAKTEGFLWFSLFLFSPFMVFYVFFFFLNKTIFFWISATFDPHPPELDGFSVAHFGFASQKRITNLLVFLNL